MKKKLLLIILILFIILLITIISIKYFKNNSQKNEETSRDFMLNQNETSIINTHGENTGIFIGTRENFLLISTKINKKTSKEEQATELISAISKNTGYTIIVNSIDFTENNIQINLSKNGAPFETTESYSATENIQYYISSEELITRTLLESIEKTLKSYFGENNTITISADSEIINY